MPSLQRRISRTWAILFGVALVAPWAAPASAGSHDGKVTLCHKGKIIRVGPIAAAYHILVHGDWPGGCGGELPPEGGGGY